MDENLFEESKQLLKLNLFLQNFCEDTSSQEFNKNVFSIKFKILFLISEYKKVSPSTLVEQLKIAKSNIALFCKQLLIEGKIKSSQDEFDKRILYYCLTKKGEQQVNQYLTILQNHIKTNISEKNLKQFNKSINSIDDVLSKI